MQWCAVCDAEHENWATRCAFCGNALVDSPPAADPSPDHSVARFDVAELDLASRSLAVLRLESGGVPHELVGDQLSVPEVHRPATEQLLAELRAEPDREGAGQELGPFDDAEEHLAASSGEHTQRSRPAGTWRRVNAALLTGLAWTAVLGVIAIVLVSSGVEDPPFFWVVALAVVLNVTLVSRVGWDPGKRLLGLRVVDREGAWPRWDRVALRSIVLFGPYLLLGFVADAVWQQQPTLGQVLAWTPELWIALVIVSIALGPQRRGWHDRLSATSVVDVRSETMAERVVRTWRP